MFFFWGWNEIVVIHLRLFEFSTIIARRWFSESGCQCLVHRDEDPDILLESIYKEGLCSDKMLYASKYSMFHIQFLLFYFIPPPSG